MARKRRKSMRDVEKFEARQFREVGMSVRDCARYFDVSVATMMRALSELCEKLGPEKIPPKYRHLVRRRIANSQTNTDSPSST